MPWKQLTDGEVLQGVRDLVRKDRIAWTRHAEERMAERGYERDQVKECLLRGWFVEPPVIPNRGGAIQYEFKMTAPVDGEQVAVVAALVPETRVVVISVIEPN